VAKHPAPWLMGPKYVVPPGYACAGDSAMNSMKTAIQTMVMKTYGLIAAHFAFAAVSQNRIVGGTPLRPRGCIWAYRDR
jgi:hypothetical protein